MRRLAAGTALLVLALQAVSADALTPSPAPPPARPGKRLDLGLFGAPYGTPLRDPAEELRFESWIEVTGEPKPDPNETMAVWWRHYNFVEPAIYGQGYNLRPDAQPNSINILPLLQKAYEKVRKR